MNESDTRLKLIDPKLKAAGWGVVPESDIATEQRAYQITDGRITTLGRKAPKKIDYLLLYKGQKMAIVEAKKDELDVSAGVEQAKLYADMMKMRYTYATNGIEIYAIDMETGKEGPVESFPTPEELWQKLYGIDNPWRDKFMFEPFNISQGKKPRYYQEIAVTKALEAIANEKKRMLLTLATGTGKTFIASQVAWKLRQTKWNKSGGGKEPKILFLTDRNTLADQAKRDFSIFPDDAMSRLAPKGLSQDDGSKKIVVSRCIYFTIFQTLMTEDKEGPVYKKYSPDFFDLIIIDECHRGGANDESSWRDIMEYFSPAFQLGLTATPKKKENANTYRYFGEPLYIYSLKQGIEDGFLTPFRVKQCKTPIDTYSYQNDDDVVSGEIDKTKIYSEEDFYHGNIMIKERDEVRVLELLEQINPEDKTIVFCATQQHAMIVRDMINRHSKKPNPFYCVRVTADDGKQGEQQLELFEENDRTIPTVLTTSQKLSTGVDARNVRNIVLMRPVNDIIEFKQIIGRGTRLYQDKYYFTVFDFVGASKNFEDPEWDGLPDFGGDDDDPQPKPNSQKVCPKCGKNPCVCIPEPCPTCGMLPCICPGGNKPERLIVRLSPTRVMSIRRNATWSESVLFDGKLISIDDFLKILFKKLPEIFGSANNLQLQWSNPKTRQTLLETLEAERISLDLLKDVQKRMAKEDCDLLDVLEFIAYEIDPMQRIQRVNQRSAQILQLIPENLQEFFGFVLGQYVTHGMEQLSSENLAKLLKLKYKDTPSYTMKERLKVDARTLRLKYEDLQRALYMPLGNSGNVTMNVDKMIISGDNTQVYPNATKIINQR